MRRAIRARGAPSPTGPYSQAIVAGSFLYLASQGPINPGTGRVEVSDAGSQARQVFANIRSICEAAGVSLDDVVRMQLFVANFNDIDAINAEYRQAFTEPYPARTTFQVSLAGFLVAAEATVLLPSDWRPSFVSEGGL